MNAMNVEQIVPFRIGRPDPLIVVQGMPNGAGRFGSRRGHRRLDDGGHACNRAADRNPGREACPGGTEPGSMKATVSRLRSLRIGETEVHSLKVAVIGLSKLNRQTRLNLGGILGYNFLRRYQVTIDYARRTIGFRGLLSRASAAVAPAWAGPNPAVRRPEPDAATSRDRRHRLSPAGRP